MRKNHRFMLRLFACSFLCVACSGMSGFDDAVSATQRRIQLGADPFVALSSLDQDFPDDPRVKGELAALLLGTGQVEAAQGYLKKADALAKDPKTRAVVAATRARVALVLGKPEDAKDYAERSLQDDPADPTGASFSLAAALASLGEGEKAFLSMEEAYRKDSTRMTRDDWRLRIRMLSTHNIQDALDAIYEYERSFPYETGTGIVESSLREQATDIDGAVLAAFKDAEYAREMGVVSDADIRERLAEIRTRLSDIAFNPGKKGFAAVDAAIAYLSGDNTALALAMVNVTSPSATASWFKAAASLGSGGTSALAGAPAVALAAFRVHEKAYGAFPSFRLACVRALGTDASTKKERMAICEAGIDTAPGGPLAPALREDLAVSLSLPSASGPSVKTRLEIEVIGYRIASSRDPVLLEPLMGLLELPDNDYTLFALGMIKGFASDPVFKSWLTDKAASSRGRLKERLDYALLQ